MLKNALLSLAFAASAAVPALADPIEPSQYNTMHSMGCMILNECTDEVQRVTSVADIEKELEGIDLEEYREEMDSILSSLDKLGIDVYLGDSRYFPSDHRGVYHAKHNRMYLNKEWMFYPEYLVDVLRHEGWHVAQDIMAGTVENTFMAIIYPEYLVPIEVKLKTDIAYAATPHVLPWEREAKWAGETPWMTAKVLEAATQGPLWEIYTPTDMTREWLVNNGFIQSGN